MKTYQRFTRSDACFPLLRLLKGFIGPGDRLFSKHLIIPVGQGHLIPRLRPAESAKRTKFDTHTHTEPPKTALTLTKLLKK